MVLKYFPRLWGTGISDAIFSYNIVNDQSKARPNFNKIGSIFT